MNEFQKYPDDKEKFDRNFLRIFGKKCPRCGGAGIEAVIGCILSCPKCLGIGYIEKKKK